MLWKTAELTKTHTKDVCLPRSLASLYYQASDHYPNSSIWSSLCGLFWSLSCCHLAALSGDSYPATPRQRKTQPLSGITWCFFSCESHSVLALLSFLNCSTPFLMDWECFTGNDFKIKILILLHSFWTNKQTHARNSTK